MFPRSEVDCLVRLVEPGVSHIIFAFCRTGVVRNVNVTWNLLILDYQAFLFSCNFCIMSYSGGAKCKNYMEYSWLFPPQMLPSKVHSLNHVIQPWIMADVFPSGNGGGGC